MDVRLGGQERALAPGVADGAGADLVEIEDHGPLTRELALVAPDEAAHAGGQGLLAAREQHVDVKVIELPAEPLRQNQGERDTRRIVVLPALGAREREVDQQGDGDDQDHGRDELGDRQRHTAHAGQAHQAAQEHRHRRPEERLERADRAADQPAEGCTTLCYPGRGREAAAPRVVVGDQDEQSWLVAVPPGDDVLRGAAPQQATDRRQQQARVEEQQQRTDECKHGADHRGRDREHAA